jgi:hypothetical protein
MRQLPGPKTVLKPTAAVVQEPLVEAHERWDGEPGLLMRLEGTLPSLATLSTNAEDAARLCCSSRDACSGRVQGVGG